VPCNFFILFERFGLQLKHFISFLSFYIFYPFDFNIKSKHKSHHFLLYSLTLTLTYSHLHIYKIINVQNNPNNTLNNLDLQKRPQNKIRNSAGSLWYSWAAKNPGDRRICNGFFPSFLPRRWWLAKHPKTQQAICFSWFF